MRLRPMRFVAYAFTDVVSGRSVNYYLDPRGALRMANTSREKGVPALVSLADLFEFGGIPKAEA